MTPFSRECLITFLNKYGTRGMISGPVADYGGAGKWGAEVKRVLATGGITDYTALDYTTGVDLLKPIKGKKYGVGVCMDLLEHTTNPFKVAENITNSLRKGAVLFVTAPFIWAPHNHPGDYFRFTVDGIKVLFPKLKCLEADLLTDVSFPAVYSLVEEALANLPEKPIYSELPHWNTRVAAVFVKE